MSVRVAIESRGWSKTGEKKSTSHSDTEATKDGNESTVKILNWNTSRYAVTNEEMQMK
jgi:hypothetical protein